MPSANFFDVTDAALFPLHAIKRSLIMLGYLVSSGLIVVEDR